MRRARNGRCARRGSMGKGEENENEKWKVENGKWKMKKNDFVKKIIFVVRMKNYKTINILNIFHFSLFSAFFYFCAASAYTFYTIILSRLRCYNIK